jgi:hypothetical protein
MDSGVIKAGLYGLMFLNLGVLLYLFKRQDVIQKRTAMVAGLLLSTLAIGSGIVIIKFDSWVANKKRRVFQVRERQYQHIGYKRLGREVAERHPGAKIMIIRYQPYDEQPSLNQGAKRSPMADLQLTALKEGIGSACTILAVEEVRAEMDHYMWEGNTRNSPSTKALYSAKLFDALVKKHKEATVVIALAGLPVDMKKMAIWQETDPKKRPALILVDVTTHNLKKALRKGFISAIMLNNFKPTSLDSPVPSDEDVAFNNRFLFITPENLEAMMEKYPKQF